MALIKLKYVIYLFSNRIQLEISIRRINYVFAVAKTAALEYALAVISLKQITRNALIFFCLPKLSVVVIHKTY